MNESNRAKQGRIVSKLLDRMDAMLDAGAVPDGKELKTLTGALKELSELRGAEEENDQCRLEVCFVGETEELSR